MVNQFLQWQGSLYWGRNSIVAVLHKGCIAHIAHIWLSQLHCIIDPLKPCHSCNSGNKCNCQNKSFFFCSVYTQVQPISNWKEVISQLRSTYRVASSYVAGVGILEVHADQTVTYFNCWRCLHAWIVPSMFMYPGSLLPRHVRGAQVQKLTEMYFAELK